MLVRQVRVLRLTLTLVPTLEHNSSPARKRWERGVN